MNILITNDDGIKAPGLAALYRALRPLGRVQVVAPVAEQSACSHTLTLHRPITVERVRLEPFGEAFAADGTPADCVRLAAAVLLEGTIDLAVSGINRGANAGVDVYYSGTVAAAREAALLGIHAIAVSQAIRESVETDWGAAAEVARHVVEQLAADRPDPAGFWSVNLPAPIPPDWRRRIFRVPVATGAVPNLFNRPPQDDGHMVFEYQRGYWNRPHTPDTDYSVIRDGGIAVSPVALWGAEPREVGRGPRHLGTKGPRDLGT